MMTHSKVFTSQSSWRRVTATKHRKGSNCEHQKAVLELCSEIRFKAADKQRSCVLIPLVDRVFLGYWLHLHRRDALKNE